MINLNVIIRRKIIITIKIIMSKILRDNIKGNSPII